MPYRKQRREERADGVEHVDWSQLVVEIDSKFYDKLHARYTGKPNQIVKFKESLALFLISPLHPRLNNHKFTHSIYRSFSFGGDHRVVYYLKDDRTAVLFDVGTHGQLY